MNTATPGIDLPLAGMTTEAFGEGFTVKLMAHLDLARLDYEHPDMHLVRAQLHNGTYLQDVYIICEDLPDQADVERFINKNKPTCPMLARYTPEGIEFLWVHLGGSQQYSVRAVS